MHGPARPAPRRRPVHAGDVTRRSGLDEARCPSARTAAAATLADRRARGRCSCSPRSFCCSPRAAARGCATGSPRTPAACVAPAAAAATSAPRCSAASCARRSTRSAACASGRPSEDARPRRHAAARGGVRLRRRRHRAPARPARRAAGLPVPVVLVRRSSARSCRSSSSGGGCAAGSARSRTQLPDLLITIAASLKAGHTFKQGMQAVVDEGQPPASEEFKRVLTETGLGRPMDDALGEMAERLGSENFEFAITAVTIQRQVGGSLAGLFDMVADTVRQRQQFARKIRSLTAMGRMSAYTLIGLPFFIAADDPLINAGYLHPLFHTSAGHMLLVSGRDDGGRLRAHPQDRLVQGVMPMLLLAAAICLGALRPRGRELVTQPARNRRARIRSAATYGNVKRRAGPGARALPRARRRAAGHVARPRDAPPQPEAGPRVARGACSCPPACGTPRRRRSSRSRARRRRGLVLGLALGASSSAAGGARVRSDARRDRLHRARDDRVGSRAQAPGGARRRPAGRARPARGQRRGGARLRRRRREAHPVHERAARRRVRARARRDARRREPRATP